MRNYNLGFISDQVIYDYVKHIVGDYRKSIDLAQFNGNTIDPIKLLIDAKVYNRSFDDVIEAECWRQIDKSNTNLIGGFSRDIFKYAGNGWMCTKNGNDIHVVNKAKHISAKIKNKHNTLNTSSAPTVYNKMEKECKADKAKTCYLVQVVSPAAQDEIWVCGGKSDPRIRIMSIDKFYAMVFGVEDAFHKLCIALPLVLEDVMNEVGIVEIKNTVCEELKKKGIETLESLFNLSFGNYSGFKK